MNAADAPLTFTAINLRFQEFSFSEKLIGYLIAKSNANVMQKLYRCCKYFYFKAPYFIVDVIYADGLKQRFENYKYNDVLISTNEHEFEIIINKIDNIWVLKKLRSYFCFHIGEALLNKIVLSDISDLCLPYIYLTMDKLKMLIKSGNLDSIYSIYGPENDNNLIRIPLEDILALVPNIEEIGFTNAHFTSQTMSKLLEIPLKRKIRRLILSDLDNTFDIELFLKFIEENLTNDAYICVSFNNEIGEKFDGMLQELKIKCEEMLKKLKKKWNLQLRSGEIQVKPFPSLPPHIVDAEKIIIKPQNFPFPQPLINYMIQAANGNQMKQLQKTCKYFYTKAPYCIIEKIYIENDTVTLNENLYNMNILNFLKPNIWLTSSLVAVEYDPAVNNNFIEKIVKCDIDHVSLWDTRITMKEFKILTKNYENISNWENYIRVIDEHHNNVSVEKLMSQFLNVKDLYLYFDHVKPQNLTKMLSIPFKNKTMMLMLDEVNEPLEVNLFFKLMKKMLAPKAHFQIKFVNELQASH